ncbi:MAG: riboflavin synthase [Bacteroidota bacterium]|nr:riboflavin synthase [Bacteroidota bacterium]
MFTGIITEIGKIESINRVGNGLQLKVKGQHSAAGLNVSDSVAINGVCQTVVAKSKNSFEVVAVEETLKKTTFSHLKIGEAVNLELAMKLNERLGGHIVQGHVDCVGKIKSITKRTASWMFTVEIPKNFVKNVIPVGSIAIDGVSLTVAELENNFVTVSVIPHTMENTILKNRKVNGGVNLEFDVLGKYVLNYFDQITSAKKQSNMTVKKLKGMGF